MCILRLLSLIDGVKSQLIDTLLNSVKSLPIRACPIDYIRGNDINRNLGRRPGILNYLSYNFDWIIKIKAISTCIDLCIMYRFECIPSVFLDLDKLDKKQIHRSGRCVKEYK